MLRLLLHTLKHRSADDSPWAKPNPLPDFVNKVLWEHGHVHSFPHGGNLWLI